METLENKYQHNGTALSQARHALIMIHGRGASADSILSLANYLPLPEDTAILAPQADHHSWYPASFIAPVDVNQPALDRGLDLIGQLVDKIVAAGIPKQEIYFLGFSQGACLTLEYVSRNAAQYAGVIAFTGGLIGQELELQNYQGNFEQTPILITTSNPDSHVPFKRVKESGEQLESMNARVRVVAYPGKPHNITDEEIELAGRVIFKKMC
jgi:phospholipase/carboxylesterase